MERICATDKRIVGLSALLSQRNIEVSLDAEVASKNCDDFEQVREQVLAQAEQQGYEAGLRRADEEIGKAAQAAKQEIVDTHSAETLRLQADRERMAALLSEIPHEIAETDAKAEVAALEAVFVAVLRIAGRATADGTLVRAICLQALAEYQVRPAVLRLSPADVGAVAGLITEPGLQVDADPALTPGECRLETHKGQYATGIAARLEALKQSFLQDMSGAQK